MKLQDENQKPIPGFQLADCLEIFGDQVEGIVRWRQGEEVGSLAGRPIRLRLWLRDAHLYSFRFREENSPFSSK